MRYINIITTSLILGYAFTSLVVALLMLSKKEATRQISKAFMETATQIVRWVGFVMLAFWLVATVLDLFNRGINSRAYGEYAWAYWIMILGPLLSQLLWIKKIRTSFIGLIFVASGLIWTSGVFMEELTMTMSSFERDYAPEGVNAEILLDILVKYFMRIASFIALVWLVQSVKARRRIYNNNKLKSSR